MLEICQEGINRLKGKKYEKFYYDVEKQLAMLQIYDNMVSKSYSLPEIFRNEISEIIGEDLDDLAEVLWDEDTGINKRLLWEMTTNKLPKLRPYLQNKIDGQNKSS